MKFKGRSELKSTQKLGHSELGVDKANDQKPLSQDLPHALRQGSAAPPPEGLRRACPVHSAGHSAEMKMHRLNLGCLWDQK